MRLALVQYAVGPDAESARLRGLEAVRIAADNGASVVAFPELSFTSFYPQYRASADVLDLAEPLDGSTVTAFRDIAQELGVVVVINIFERDGDRAYDSSPVIDADGSLLGVARMAHITDYDCFFEQGYYAPGDTLAPVFETAAGRIGVAICYDRHYPEYMRSLGLQGADLVIIPQAGVVGEWPDGMYEGEIRVAAFQNGYFCAMVNRNGSEDRLEFAGGSVVSDPTGRIIAQAPYQQETILYADLELQQTALSPARKLFLRDRRPDIYEGGAVRYARKR